jgi:hypothetical protein
MCVMDNGIYTNRNNTGIEQLLDMNPATSILLNPSSPTPFNLPLLQA